MKKKKKKKKKKRKKKILVSYKKSHKSGHLQTFLCQRIFKNINNYHYQ